MDTCPMTESTVDETKRRGGWGWSVAGLAFSVVTVGATYGVAQSNLELGVQILVIAGLLLLLAVLAYLASRAGRSAVFVAIAILLPYLLAGAYAYGAYNRVANALEDVFGTDDTSIEVPEEIYPEETEPESDVMTQAPEDYVPLAPNPDATGADLNEDGIPDDAYEGQVCMSESSGEVQLCAMNGGLMDAR